MHRHSAFGWASLLRKQAADVADYLADDPEGVRAARIAAVLGDGESTSLVPSGALDAERQLFLADLRVVFGLLTRQPLHVGSAGDRARMYTILDLLESPRLSSLGLQDFATTCAISAGWLRKWLKRFAGDSFPALFGRARLKQATRILRTTGTRVADAARVAGYQHRPDFYRDFKSLLGATPAGYQCHWRRTLCPQCPAHVQLRCRPSAGFDT